MLKLPVGGAKDQALYGYYCRLIPRRFVDLGKLFDTDSENELHSLFEPRPQKVKQDIPSSVSSPKVELVPKMVMVENAFGVEISIEDFIIDEGSVTPLFEEVTAQ